MYKSRKYKVDYLLNYYQAGGSENFNPIYNSVWPPKLNSLIWTKKDKNGRIYEGNVVEYIWNQTAKCFKNY